MVPMKVIVSIAGPSCCGRCVARSIIKVSQKYRIIVAATWPQGMNMHAVPIMVVSLSVRVSCLQSLPNCNEYVPIHFETSGVRATSRAVGPSNYTKFPSVMFDEPE